MHNLALVMEGETWVSYPLGMRFPAWFQRNYPFRGRGIVSRVLYLLNTLRLDSVFLKKVVPPDVSDELRSNVAFFWPSSRRSTVRFYGYRVESGVMTEYLKLATTEAEKKVLLREAENVKTARSISNGSFFVPDLIGIEDFGRILAVRYQSLPSNAETCPIDDRWIGKVKSALKNISDAGYVHGDFAWHNFKAVGDELWILDWEEMSKELPRLSDAVELETSIAYYWKNAPLENVLRDFDEKYLLDAAVAEDAVLAIKDLRARRISMGNILWEHLKTKGLVCQ